MAKIKTKSQIKSVDKIFKSYVLQHKSNPGKVDSLFQLYSIYKSEYKKHTQNYWQQFLNNQLKSNSFSHLGSTKEIKTKLNASYLQICLSQSCAVLNNYLSNIKEKFNEFISQSSIKDKDTLHQLRTINSTRSWLKLEVFYYPEVNKYLTDNFGNLFLDNRKDITDDYGNLLKINLKVKTPVKPNLLKLSRQIFKHIKEKERVKFPNLNKPRLLIDDRVYSLEKTKKLNNKATFNYWLKITTMEKGKRISIPIKTNKFFDASSGLLGKTIELNFNTFDYDLIQHKHNSLNKPKKNKVNNLQNKGLVKVKRKVEFIFNKQHTLEEISQSVLNKNSLKLENNNFPLPSLSIKNRTVAFDLGLCNLIATSEGQLLGTYWLDKLKIYDKKIQDLAAARQSIGLKTRSKRYDELIRQVKGFIKTETNRILNSYFSRPQNYDIETVVIEKLDFNQPELSRKLNRIIKNFGQNIFKTKLSDLSLIYGFKVEEINPAYTSQECHSCHHISHLNRVKQEIFKCTNKNCSQHNIEMNADSNSALNIKNRILNRELRNKLNKDNVYLCARPKPIYYRSVKTIITDIFKDTYSNEVYKLGVVTELFPENIASRIQSKKEKASPFRAG